MIRNIIKIDEEKCNGCGLCVPACIEGAIQIMDGKARLVSETYCDGLGACIGECPQGALTIEQREADQFDEEAVQEHLARTAVKNDPVPCCPGSALQSLHTDTSIADTPTGQQPSQLMNWPVQLKLVPPFAPYLNQTDLLICADCVPFALPDFHQRFLKGRTVLVGCPKLDDITYYAEKLGTIFREAQPSRITVLRMEVPCCSGIAGAVINARNNAIPDVPLNVTVIGIRGDVLDNEIV